MESQLTKTDTRSPALLDAEFDRFSSGYDQTRHHVLWSLAGKRADNFMSAKTNLLLRQIASDFPNQSLGKLRLLDFGCGTAILLRQLCQLGFPGQVAGCDVSPGMLREAVSQWRLPAHPIPELQPINAGVAQFPDESFEVIVACAVLHHVPPTERHNVYQDIFRLLKPGGRFYVFEHNPWNPLTQFVVKRAPVDRDAVLLRAGEVSERIEAVGLRNARCKHFMFFPPRWKWVQPVERLISWLPFGGQYFVSACKPAECKAALHATTPKQSACGESL